MRRDIELVAVESPFDAATQRELKAREYAHDDGIGVLGVEIGVGEQPRLM